MSNEPEQERSLSGRTTSGSILNELVNLAGFWMAAFSLAGLVMLTVAGPIVQKRMSRRSIPSSELTQRPATATNGIDSGASSENRSGASQGANVYSLDGLWWALTIFFFLGVFWSGTSMLKPRFASPII